MEFEKTQFENKLLKKIKVYSAWEIDCTIQEVIANACEKWQCTRSEAKRKLQTKLWIIDENEMEEKLQSKHNELQGISDIHHDTSAPDNIDMYNIQLNCMTYNVSDPCEQQMINSNDLPVLKESYSCPICLENKCRMAGIKLYCDHWICRLCLIDYITNQIDNGLTFIECPAWKCKSTINEAVIHVMSDNIAYSRYRKFLQNAFLDVTVK